mmetsp:Transcript_43976/g.104083  ORF Transcript_43976/g.104083 Transcript_43976/m.104083 type:complete len:275 (-) Transcript_43976:9-833(-)
MAKSDDESVHSAVSYESGAEDDEDTEYLALELLQHLPVEKANKIIRSLQNKDKALKELQERHQKLLASYQQLSEAKSKPPAAPAPAPTLTPAAPAPATSGAAPAANGGAPEVDKSIWQKMQANKDDTISKLKEENYILRVQVARLDDYSRQLGQSLKDMQKDFKKAIRNIDPRGERIQAGGDSEEERPDFSADLAALEAYEREHPPQAEAAPRNGNPQPEADAAKSKSKRKKKTRSELKAAKAAAAAGGADKEADDLPSDGATSPPEASQANDS